jgi:hypothetical protein
MKPRLLLGPALVSILVAASFSSVSSVSAAAPSASVRRADGYLPGVIPYRGGPQIAQATAQCKSPKLAYFGGPLLQSPVIIAVFWNSSVNATLTASIGQFYTDVTQSSYWTWLQEYNTVGLSPGTNQAILPGSFGGSFTLTPSRCPAGTAACSITDAELQSELAAQIESSALPAPTLDCTGNSNTIYMVSFPPNVTLSGPDGAGNSCANGGFCAYHNTGTYGTSKTPIVYAALMDQFTGPCKSGCGGNSTPLENSTDAASHELVEAVTDADIGLDTQNGYADPAGWGDNSNQCGEIADICDDGKAGDTITVSGRTWVVQELWSNKQGKCTSTGPDLPVCSEAAPTSCRACSCGDNGGACATPQTCGGGGVATQCGCAALTACPAGADCGSVPDNCGGTLQCGTCTAPQTCGGGGGGANQCGCTPLTACPAGNNCGSIPDNCGGTLECGTCAANEVCTNNQCASSTSSTSASSTSASGGTPTSGAGGSVSSASGSTFGNGGAGAGPVSSTGEGGATEGSGGSGASGTNSKSGCGCEAAGEPLGSSVPGLSALGVLALAATLRDRQRRRMG